MALLMFPTQLLIFNIFFAAYNHGLNLKIIFVSAFVLPLLIITQNEKNECAVFNIAVQSE
jgi:hypothetical protein